MGKLTILNICVAPVNFETINASILYKINLQSKAYITVTGVHGIMESLRNECVRQAHAGAWLTVPDGMPLVYIGKLHGHKEIERCYGPDLMEAVMADSVKQGYRHFFYGGKEGIAEELKSHFEMKYPGIQIVGTYTPPFRPLNESEFHQLEKQVAAVKPHIMWIGLSTPKQELFMHDYIDRLDTNLMIGVGAAFDIHTRHISSAPSWMQKCALEWLYRLIQEPRRLWKRYLINNPLFIFCYLLQLLKVKNYNSI